MTGPGALPDTRVPETPYRRPEPVVTETLRLDGNEGSQPPGSLLESVAALPASSMRDYPDLEPLERALAARHQVEPDRIVVTAGADDAIDRVLRAYAPAGSEVIVPTPTFEMVHRFAQAAGARVRTASWTQTFPLAGVEALVGPETRVIVVISPNNPTGRVVTASELERLARSFPSVLILFDHVYAEYADEDLSATARRHPNVVMLRTFSKAWGLAGCRVGYAVASPAVARTLRNAANPYPVSSISAHLALERLRGAEGEMQRHVARVRRERRWLTDFLARREIACSESQGNFVLAELGERADLVERGLASLGVLVRRFPNRPEIATSIRITLPGGEAAFARLIRALDTVLDPEALLFDLDGVLADVEESYRRATLETLASYGLSVTREELRAAVLAGDANNDWVLSQRILAGRGIDAPLDEITARFQALYLGESGKAGYRERERPIVSKETLEGWSRRLPLGVVTGRPRAEAEWFLERHGLAGSFSALVTLEDAPGKPDPSPVRLALRALGVERAWMLGDTPDDIAAARGAGVLPLAVPAPGEDAPDTRERLRRAGAALVLDTTANLEELL